MSRGPIRWMLTIVAVGSLFAAQDAAAPSAPAVDDLLASMQSAYAGLEAFECSGWVDTEVPDKSGCLSSGLFGYREFNAQFAKPDTLAFKLKHPGSSEYVPWSYSLSSRGSEATTSTVPAEEARTVWNALSGAFGITSRAANLVFGLLCPQVATELRLQDLRDARIVGTEIVEAEDCWRLEAKLKRMRRAATFWVSRRTSIVCRAQFDLDLDDGILRDTICLTSVRAARADQAQLVTLFVGEGR